MTEPFSDMPPEIRAELARRQQTFDAAVISMIGQCGAGLLIGASRAEVAEHLAFQLEEKLKEDENVDNRLETATTLVGYAVAMLAEAGLEVLTAAGGVPR